MPRSLYPIELANYDVLPRELAERARVVVVPVLPRGASGMTIGRWIFLRNDDARGGDRTLLVHELVHVRQYRELGYLPFSIRYLREYFTNLVKLRNHDAAYRAISLEVEAYEIADRWQRAMAASPAGPGGS